METAIRRILNEHGKLTVDATTIGVHDDLYRVGLTSHATVNVMLEVEDEFDIEFPDGDLTKSTFESIASLSAVVGRLTGAAA